MELWLTVRAASAILLALGACAGCKRPSADLDAQAEARRTFAMVCARCHGPDGRGNGLTPTATAPRNFRDAAFQKERSDADLERAIGDGKGAMPPFRSIYGEEQLRALVQVIRDFDPARTPPKN